MTKRNSNLDGADFGAIELSDALRQPLTAACNYIGAARVLLASRDQQSSARAVESLDKAEMQILRAGDIVRRFQRSMVTQRAND